MMFFHLATKTKIKNTGRHAAQGKLLPFWMAIFVFIGQFSPTLTQTASAQTFDPNNIISDDFLFTSGRLTVSAIQNFFEQKNSVLARYSEIINGQAKSAAQIIHDAAKQWSVAEEFLLANLEKEQALIRSTHATEKQLDWAMGYGCFSGQCKDKYKGFSNQIDSAAETQQIYRKRTFGFNPGKTTVTHDGYSITPANDATANLYIYTPYVGHAPELGIESPFGGVKLFWKIITRYFPEKKYPDGVFVTNHTDYWMIDKGKKRKFISREVFLKDHEPADAIFISQTDLQKYPEGQILYFPNNTLVRSSVSSQVYLIANNKKRLVVNDTALALLSDFHIAFNTLQEVPTAEHNQINSYPDGEPITESTLYPQGKLFQVPSGEIYLIKDKMKHPVHPDVLRINYPGQTPEPISQELTEGYFTLSPITFTSGKIVKNTAGEVYFVSGEKLLKVEGQTAVKIFGNLKIQSASVVSKEALDLHEAGINLDYIDDSIQDIPTTQDAYTPPAETYSGTFKGIDPADLILIAGETRSVTINFQNTGSSAWGQNDVWVSSGENGNKVYPLQTAIQPNEAATFQVKITAPDKTGIFSQRFTLYRNSNGTEVKLASAGKFIPVTGGSTTEWIEDNLPIAVKEKWKPIHIEITLKNTGEKTWYSPKTALKMYNEHGGQSPFYDPHDWVRKDVVGVPLNKKNISPGEEGVFRFTIDPRGERIGVHTYILELQRLDEEEGKQQVYINGQKQIVKKIRVDN